MGGMSNKGSGQDVEYPEIEVLDLAKLTEGSSHEPSELCWTLPEYPEPGLNQHVAGFHKQKWGFFACGGESFRSTGPIIGSCYSYNNNTKQWDEMPNMVQTRKMAGLTTMDNDILVMGGIIKQNYDNTESGEVLASKGKNESNSVKKKIWNFLNQVLVKIGLHLKHPCLLA